MAADRFRRGGILQDEVYQSIRIDRLFLRSCGQYEMRLWFGAEVLASVPITVEEIP